MKSGAEHMTGHSDEQDPEDEGKEAPEDDHHLADIEDGSGCTEIWEQLSERRENDEED